MDEVHKWHNATLAKETIAALENNGFKAVYVEKAGDVAELLKPFLVKDAKIGFGGSTTVKNLGVAEQAKAAGCIVLDHSDPSLSPEARMDVLRGQLHSDVFISSSNAVSLDGHIINVDGNGNRVAALTFGPKKTIVIAGVNKIVRDLEDGLNRIEMHASPLNNKRLNKTNPCVQTGECQDCDEETRICRVYQIISRRPSLSDFTVILVGESLGY